MSGLRECQQSERDAFRADHVYELQHALAKQDLVMAALVLDWLAWPDDSEWPFDDITFDYYDRSFELKGAKPGLRFSPAAVEDIKRRGFLNYYICYTDGTEFHEGPDRYTAQGDIYVRCAEPPETAAP